MISKCYFCVGFLGSDGFVTLGLKVSMMTLWWPANFSSEEQYLSCFLCCKRFLGYICRKRGHWSWTVFSFASKMKKRTSWQQSHLIVLTHFHTHLIHLLKRSVRVDFSCAELAQRLHFLCLLRLFGVSTSVMLTSYNVVMGSLIRFRTAARFGSISVQC